MATAPSRDPKEPFLSDIQAHWTRRGHRRPSSRLWARARDPI